MTNNEILYWLIENNNLFSWTVHNLIKASMKALRYYNSYLKKCNRPLVSCWFIHISKTQRHVAEKVRWEETENGPRKQLIGLEKEQVILLFQGTLSNPANNFYLNLAADFSCVGSISKGKHGLLSVRKSMAFCEFAINQNGKCEIQLRIATAFS